MIQFTQKRRIISSVTFFVLFYKFYFFTTAAAVLASRAEGYANTRATSSECEYVENMLEVVTGPRHPKELFPDIDLVRNFYDSGKSIKEFFNAVISRQNKRNINSCIRKFSSFCEQKNVI